MSIVIRSDGSQKRVKNLGWLLRHWKEVESLSINTRYSKDVATLTAHMDNGDRFVSYWADSSILLNWIKRPVFFGLPVIIDGGEYVVEPVKNNPSPKLSRSQKDALVALLNGRQPNTSEENIEVLLMHGFVTYDNLGQEYELTESGFEIAQSEFQLKEQARKKRNATARGRSAALSGLGMKRTKYGWE